MASRTIAIRIVIDNRDAINNAKAQTIAMKALGDETYKATHLQEGLTASFLKGNLAARAISMSFMFFKDSIKMVITETAQLELAMARTQAVSGLSSDGVNSLKESIFALSRTSLASVSDLGRTALELSKLGIAGEDLSKVLAGVSNLSAILGDSLESTAALVSGVATTFNISGSEMTEIADKLFAATGKSITNIEGYKVAFSLAGNAAEQAGVTFEELSALIAVMSNQGIRASTIGTGLRTFFINMTQEGSKASKMLGTLGEKGLVGLMDELARLKPDAGSLFEMFGKPGLPVAAGMTKSKVAYEEFLAAINGSEGTLTKNAKLINDTLIGSFVSLKNAIVELTSAAGDTSGLTKLFRVFAEGMQATTDKMNINKEFDKFVTEKGYLGALKALEVDESILIRQKPLSEMVTAPLLLNPNDRDRLVESFRVYREAQKNAKAIATDSRKMQSDFMAGKPDNTKNSLDIPGDGKESAKTKKLRQGLVNQFMFLDTAMKKEPVAETGLDLETLNQQTDGWRENKEIMEHRADVLKYNMDLEQEWAINNQLMIQLQQSLTLAVNQTTQALGEGLVNSIIRGQNAFQNFGTTFGNITKQILIDLTAMIIKMLLFKAISTAIGFGAPGMTFAKGGNPFVGALLSSLGGQQQHASGGSFVTNGPTPIMVGESGRERVQITPRSKMSSGASQGVTVVIQGNVFGGEQFNEAIAVAEKRLSGRSV